MAKSILDYGMGPLKNPPSSKPGGGKIIVPPNATGSGNKIFAPPAGAGSSGSNVIQRPSSGGSGSIVQPGGGSVTSAPTYTAPSSAAPTGQGYSAPGMDANGQVDIGSQIDSAISSGKGYQYVQDLLNQRYDKINANPGQLGKYEYDALSKRAEGYIQSGKDKENQDRITSEYNANAAREQAALDAYLDQITGSLGGQKRGVEQDAEKLAREAYLSYMQSMRTAPQALSASGYSGGMADSQLAALQANLQSNQNKIQENKVNAIYGIDQAITDAQMQANVESARQKADMGKAALDAWNSYLSQEKQIGLSREQMAGENARWEKEFGNSQLQTQYNRDKEAALTQAGAGNFAALSKLWGLSDQDTATLISDYAQQKQIAATQAARELADWKGQYGDFSDLKNMGVNVNLGALKSGGTGGGDSSLPGKPRLSQSAVIAAIESGMVTPEVRSAWEYYNRASFGDYFQEEDESGTPITDYNQLGKAAQGLLSGAASPSATPDKIASQLEQYLAQGVITQAEADYILTSIGH